MVAVLRRCGCARLCLGGSRGGVCGVAGVPGAGCALSGRAAWCARWRWPAREPSAPRAPLGASSRSPARPRRHLIDFARNSSIAHSNIEFASLALQRFWGVSKNDRDKLRARFGWRRCRRRPWVSQLGAAHARCVWVLQARWSGGLKPSSPLLAWACVGLKPRSPLRVRNGRFWCVFRAQRCRRFQRPRVGGEQWCCWFHRRYVSASCARHLSPCSA